MSKETIEKKEFYKSSFEHIQDELRRMDILIHNCIVRLREERRDNIPDDYRGLFVSEEEIDGILSKAKEKNKLKVRRLETEISKECITEFQKRINDKISSSVEKNIYLSLFHLGYLFRLMSFEVDCLLLCLAIELDLKYERLYAYIHNDVTKKSPTVDLVLKVLCSSPEERKKVRTFFSSDSTLFKYNLLSFPSAKQDGESPFLSKSLKLDERVTDFLLESKELDQKISPFVRLIKPAFELSDVVIPDGLKEQVRSLSLNIKEEIKNPKSCNSILKSIFYFKGPPGNCQRETIEAICNELGLFILEVDFDSMMNSEMSFDFILKIVLRESLFQRAVVYFRGFDRLLADEDKNMKEENLFIKEIEGFPGMIFIEGSKSWILKNNRVPVNFFSFDFEIPPYPLRKNLWEKHLGKIVGGNNLDVSDIAEKFKLTKEQIRDAVNIALSESTIRNPANPEITMEDLYKGCRLSSNQKLSSLSRKIVPKYSWEDIVLPEDRLNQLKEICSYVKYKNVVYGDWGFGKKLSLGRGLSALFFGISGTGKTMAAEIIAGDLQLDLYKIDLSTVVSKYIGETEKNLNKIFSEAETSNSIIFFDECDAIFGKRSEVKDAHDRYANIEIAYLLQKIEEYEGIVILATNFRKNMDDAFVRRIHFTVEFPFPEEKDRLGIWKGVFPEDAPTEDIDYEFLAKKFKITGGNIKNIAVCSAFLAAEDSKKINMRHVVRAIKREFLKMGKLTTEADYGKYYNLSEK
jgi:SpoVK/Ycf46/Vps4 family AAA+-type ATPase